MPLSPFSVSVRTAAKWFEVGGRRRAWFARVVFIVVFAALLASAGCGTLTYERRVFPDEIVTADGGGVSLDDVAEIVNDPALDEEGKREALRELGIEDEDVIDALIASG
jgi:hypothetical protein